MNNSAMAAFRQGRKHTCIVVAAISMISGCQSVDATKTSSVLIRPVVHSVRSKPAVYSAPRRSMAHSLRSDPLVQVTSKIRTTARAYALAPPQPIKVRTAAPVKVSYSPVNGGPLLGSSPYVCSPSGFGQRASCRARYL
jgi:hypothetical protein